MRKGFKDVHIESRRGIRLGELLRAASIITSHKKAFLSMVPDTLACFGYRYREMAHARSSKQAVKDLQR